MAQANILAQIQPYDADANVVAGLAVPSTCLGIIKIKLTNGNFVYKAYGTGAPSTDYNNLSLGSEYTDLTNYKIYIMTAAATWTLIASNT